MTTTLEQQWIRTKVAIWVDVWNINSHGQFLLPLLQRRNRLGTRSSTDSAPARLGFIFVRLCFSRFGTAWNETGEWEGGRKGEKLTVPLKSTLNRQPTLELRSKSASPGRNPTRPSEHLTMCLFNFELISEFNQLKRVKRHDLIPLICLPHNVGWF